MLSAQHACSHEAMDRVSFSSPLRFPGSRFQEHKTPLGFCLSMHSRHHVL